MESVKFTGQQLAERGYAVHRIGAKEKYPVGIGAWQSRRAPSAKEIAKELRGASRLGVRCGGGLFVLDADVFEETGKDGKAALAAYAEGIGWELPPWTAYTGGGGAHLWLRVPEGVRMRNGASLQRLETPFGRGVDWRGDGGQVVVPPSSHDSGTPYRWADGLPPPLAELPAAPPEVVEAARAATFDEYAARMQELTAGLPDRTPDGEGKALGGDDGARVGISEALDRVRAAPVGERNTQLNSNAWFAFGFVKAGRADRESVWSAMLQAALEERWGGEPGQEREAVEATLRSAWSGAVPQRDQLNVQRGTNDPEAWRYPRKRELRGGEPVKFEPIR